MKIARRIVFAVLVLIGALTVCVAYTGSLNRVKSDARDHNYIYDETYPSVVKLRVEFVWPTGSPVVITGVAVGNKGTSTQILTVAHGCLGPLFMPPTEITAETIFGDLIEGHYVKSEVTTDLCLITLDTPIQSLPVSNHYEPTPGDFVYTVGSPRGVFPVISTGLFSMRTEDGLNLFTFPVTNGFSGSPVIRNGSVVGVVSMRLVGYENAALAIPLEHIQEFLE